MSQSGLASSSSSGGGGTTSFVTDDGIATPSSGGVIELLGGSNVTTTGAGNIIMISSSGGGGGITWNVVTNANNPVNLVTQNGYIASGAGIVNFVLPAAANVGDYYRIAGQGNLWTLTENASQYIMAGIETTTAGSGGLQALTVSDGVELLCTGMNRIFYVLSMQGNIQIN